ncbi:hypothetical protein Back11_13720 [Paenibacillus baekrokdamisoli]|uniref:Uncharacterized protein n=1 Tax=Paenibacillus baekrokdamisoli TaxID=1712516 RepID=A0A3G9IM56_9BACL|nr:DUF3153 domain-containing protein [Paenibacillus baekrokdamisoli]MBB3070678.1 hypothetical protein [Paenibacillus baekrokdamisoli]BBH20027.1 hypothetical protein Back11_13720 [Paenibacillus baekrokdamisoli]
MKFKLLKVIGLIVIFVLLTGCASGTAHIIIKKDGSVDLKISARIDSRTLKLIGAQMEDTLETKAKEEGYQYNKTQTEEYVDYQISRTFASADEMKKAFGNTNDSTMNVSKTDRLFYTKYTIDGQIEMNAYTNGMIQSIEKLNVPKPLITLLLRQFVFNLKITFPLNLIGDNNANEVTGKTLTWQVPLTEDKPFHLEFFVPNVKNIIYIIAGLIVFVIVIVIFFVRKRRRKRKV